MTQIERLDTIFACEGAVLWGGVRVLLIEYEFDIKGCVLATLLSETGKKKKYVEKILPIDLDYFIKTCWNQLDDFEPIGNVEEEKTAHLYQELDTMKQEINGVIQEKEFAEVKIDALQERIVKRDNKISELEERLSKEKSKPKTVHVMNDKTSNLNELRNKLLANISDIEEGKLEVGKAAAIASHTQVIINLTKLEMEYRKKFPDGGDNGFLQLGK